MSDFEVMWRRGIIRISPIARKGAYDHLTIKDCGPEEVKKKLPEWRKPWREESKGVIKMLESIRTGHKPNEELLEVLAGSDRPIRKLINLWRNSELRRTGRSLEYRADRVQSLGVDLAVGFFVIYRGGRVG